MAATALPPFDVAALSRFLTGASGAEKVEVTACELLAGGAVQENWGLDVFFSDGRLAGPQRLVLRTNAASGIPSSLPRLDEFAVLQAAFAAGVTVPEPLFACADPGVIGKPSFVMRRLAGTAQGGQITTEPALEPVLPQIAYRLGEELARLQTIRPPRPDLAFLDRGEANGPAAQIAGFRTYLDLHPNPRPVLEWAIRWLETHIPPPLGPVLCHRDFRTGNYLLEGARLPARCRRSRIQRATCRAASNSPNSVVGCCSTSCSRYCRRSATARLTSSRPPSQSRTAKLAPGR